MENGTSKVSLTKVWDGWVGSMQDPWYRALHPHAKAISILVMMFRNGVYSLSSILAFSISNSFEPYL